MLSHYHISIMIMGEAIVSSVMQQLTSIIGKGIQQEVMLVIGADKEVKELRNDLQAIQVVLIDAEKRRVKERNVRLLSSSAGISGSLAFVFETVALPVEISVDVGPVVVLSHLSYRTVATGKDLKLKIL